ncbi:MAG: hypothetical protein JW904_11620 [Spirochaetales bacterium]|nr:hypothetical protein [Spirochaetales bacterium]
MKRLLVLVVFCLIATVYSHAEENEAPFSFGMPFIVQYNNQTSDLTIWNFRYGLGIDFYFKIMPSIYLGVEIGSAFGFRKNDFFDQNFQEFFIDFPLRAVILWKLPVIVLEAYTGANYQGNALLVNGTLYAEDLDFHLNYEIGARIGLGELTFFFLDVGYVLAEESYLHAGLGVRIGLF